MKTGASATRRAFSVAIVFAIGLACAGAQTTAENTFPPDDVTILNKPGPIPGPGLTVLVRHVTTCDRFNSLPATNRPASTLSGCIRGAVKARGAIKVQIHGVHTSRVVDAVADEFGEFMLGNVPVGDYVLLATQGTTILTLRTFHFPLNMPLVAGYVLPHLSGVAALYLSDY
ncbi:MAG: hypothetical protein WA654_16810 [Candidatus Sulfotelmatobacter sp.]